MLLQLQIRGPGSPGKDEEAGRCHRAQGSVRRLRPARRVQCPRERAERHEAETQDVCDLQERARLHLQQAEASDVEVHGAGRATARDAGQQADNIMKKCGKNQALTSEYLSSILRNERSTLDENALSTVFMAT